MNPLELNGEFVTTATCEMVRGLIATPQSLVTVLPGVEAFSVENGVTSVRFKLDLEKIGRGIGSMHMSTATAMMRFQYVELNDNGVEIKGKGRALGSALGISVSIRFREGDGGTEISWNALVDSGLLLRIFGEDAVEMTSRELIGQIVANLQERLSK